MFDSTYQPCLATHMHLGIPWNSSHAHSCVYVRSFFSRHDGTLFRGSLNLLRTEVAIQVRKKTKQLCTYMQSRVRLNHARLYWHLPCCGHVATYIIMLLVQNSTVCKIARLHKRTSCQMTSRTVSKTLSVCSVKVPRISEHISGSFGNLQCVPLQAGS